MRYLPLLLILLAFPALSQNTDPGTLEAELAGKSGADYAQAAIAVADAYARTGQWEKSADLAAKAYKEANAAGNNELRAMALNREAKGLLYTPNPKAGYKVRVADKLQESNRLTQDKSLRIDNLKLLRTIARNDRERQRVDSELLALEAINAADQASQELNQFKVQTEEQQQALQQELEQRQTVIATMSESQAKTQLLLEQQKNLLNSLAFENMLDSLELDKKIMALRESELQKSEAEAKLKLRNSQIGLGLAIAIIGVILGVAMYSRYISTKKFNSSLQEKNLLIESEKKRSDDLLNNILPEEVAEELKRNGKASARRYEQATVLFTDFKDFSRMAQEMDPAELVRSLDYCFRAFDEIVEIYGLEKIKTIGDAYMCAGGLPVSDPNHPPRVVKAALEMQRFLNRWKAESPKAFQARIGIHTGPVVAGVVGMKKFAYDIWGPTVNIASRMESSSEPGRVNISVDTFKLVKDSFSCTPRGKVQVKNIGELDMYFVEG